MGAAPDRGADVSGYAASVIAGPLKAGQMDPDRTWYARGDHVVVSSIWLTNELPGSLVVVGMDRQGLERLEAVLKAAGYGVELWPERAPEPAQGDQ